MLQRNAISKFNRLDALSLWHRINLDNVLDQVTDLSPRQMAVLTTVYLESGPHTVRSLAKSLDVTKAVVTRALDTLGRAGFILRAPDPLDKRSVVIQRTGPGSKYLSHFAENVRRQIKLSVAKANAA